MPRRFTVSALVTSCKQQVDLENHAVISDAEWLGLLSRAYGELYTIVFESGLGYFEYSSTLTADGTNQLAEAADMLSTVTLAQIVDAGGARRDLRQLMPQERSRMSGQTGSARFFALVDDKIYLYPTPPTGETYEIRYVPQPPDLTTYSTGDLVDVVTPDGHEFLIWAVSVKACGKTESDPTLAIRERESARERFTESVRLRALTNSPRRIMDMGGDDLDERYGW